MATTPTRLMTFAEVDQLPDPSDGHYELHHGELVKMPVPKMFHYLIQERLRDLLRDAAGESGFVGTELGFRDSRNTNTAELMWCMFLANGGCESTQRTSSEGLRTW